MHGLPVREVINKASSVPSETGESNEVKVGKRVIDNLFINLFIHFRVISLLSFSLYEAG